MVGRNELNFKRFRKEVEEKNSETPPDSGPHSRALQVVRGTV